MKNPMNRKPTFQEIVAGLMVLFFILMPPLGCAPKATTTAPDVPSQVSDIICSPTADQIDAWSQDILSGTDLIAFLALLPQTAVIAAILDGLKASVKVLDQARQSICTRLADIEQAKTNIQNAQTTAAMKYGYKPKH